MDPTQLKNYRPISKLPLLSKILEKVVADQLTSILEKHEIYDKFQSGFHKSHSTETTLLKVSSDIIMLADSGASSVMVLLDLTSAFDTIDISNQTASWFSWLICSPEHQVPWCDL